MSKNTKKMKSMLSLGLSKVWHRLRERKEDNLKLITTPLFGIYPKEIIRFRERSYGFWVEERGKGVWDGHVHMYIQCCIQKG